MNRCKSLGALAVTMLMVASSSPLAASSGETSTSYDATYEYDADSTAQKLDETMTLRRGEPQTFIKLTSSGGASFDAPTKFGADGEIESVSNDPSVTCYNMAASAVYQKMHAPDQPNYVYIHAGDGIARIPMTIAESKTPDGSRIFTGSGKQTIGMQSETGSVSLTLTVDSKIRVVGDTIMDITFAQTTSLGSSGGVITKQTCSLRPQEGPASLT